MKQRLVLAAVLAAAAVPMPAEAQQWLADRRLAEGMGIRVGNLELHPAIAAEFGYDSNYFQLADTAAEPVVSAYRLRVTPSLSLATLGPQRRGANPGVPPALLFRAGVYAAYNELWAADSDHSEAVKDQRHVDVGANVRVDINPQRPIGADIYVDYERVGEPSNQDAFGTGEATQGSFDRDSVRGGLGATWRPGGGSFEWRLGYEALYNYFEDEDFQFDNNLQHTVVMRGRWRFFPRTALLYDGSYRFIRYTSDSANVPRDGDIVRARVGLNGLVTPRISLLGLVGWTSSFYDGQGDDADTIVAQAEAKYFVIAPNSTETASTGLSTIALGFTREISNSYLSSFYTRSRGYLNASYFLGGVFVASAELGYGLISFPNGEEYLSLDQQRLDARLFAEYRISNSIGINSTLLFAQNMSDDLRPVAPAPGLPLDDLDYTRWQAYIGLRWFM